MANTNPLNDSETLLRLCLKHLTNKDFTAAQKFALLAQKSHPNRPEFPQISTIAAVHLAAGNRLPDNQVDHLSILQLDRRNSNYDIHTMRTKFKYLLLSLHPSKNKYPFAKEGLQIVLNAWSVLSGSYNKTQMGNAGENHGCSVKETFWTVCPYCYYMFEYEGLYKDCCFRCQNCGRAFQGVPVAAPEKNVIVQGKEEYYCRVGWFPLEYYNSCLDEKKRKRDNSGFTGASDDVKNEELKSVGVEKNGESNVNTDETEMQGSGGRVKVGSKGKRVKSTARNTKKIMGRGRRVNMDMKKTEFVDLSEETDEEIGSKDLDFSVDDLEIIVGDDDIYFGPKKHD